MNAWDDLRAASSEITLGPRATQALREVLLAVRHPGADAVATRARHRVQWPALHDALDRLDRAVDLDDATSVFDQIAPERPDVVDVELEAGGSGR